MPNKLTQKARKLKNRICHLHKLRGEIQESQRGQPRQPRRQLSKRLKQEIGGQTGFKCHCCGKRLIHANHKRQYDHIRPRSIGGHDGVKNFLLSCDACNNGRKAKLPEEIRLILALGEMARRQILEDTELGRQIAEVAVKRPLVKSWLNSPLPRKANALDLMESQPD